MYKIEEEALTSQTKEDYAQDTESPSRLIQVLSTLRRRVSYTQREVIALRELRIRILFQSISSHRGCHYQR